MLKLLRGFSLLTLTALLACQPAATQPGAQPSVSGTPGPGVSNSPTPSPAASASAPLQPSPSATPTASQQPSSAPSATPQPSSTPLPDKSENRFGMNFVRIEPGTFMMGSPATENGHETDEVQHQVTLTQPFLMQTTEVTQGQWLAVMGSNPSFYKQPENLQQPVENVSWQQVQAFISKLNQLGDGQYRLPTEAEWEYAARAGSTTPYFFGANPRFLNPYAWFVNTSGEPPMPHPVGQKLPNAFGLYDTIGNVAEFVQDNYNGNLGSQPVTDPQIFQDFGLRVYRDCFFASPELDCRVANRQAVRPDFVVEGQVGFRLVRQ